jgi:hypothetical protein
MKKDCIASLLPHERSRKPRVINPTNANTVSASKNKVSHLSSVRYPCRRLDGMHSTRGRTVGAIYPGEALLHHVPATWTIF